MSNLSRLFISIILSFAFSINYLDEIQPIFNASCVSCHNSDSQNYSNHQLDLTSYSGLMNGGESGDVITPYDASSSILYQEVSSGNMPQYGSGEFLVAEQINLIADWINDGALEEEDDNELEGECLDSNDCEDGLFCNMDHTSDEEVTAGSCEPCDYYSAIEDCLTDGLPEAGEAECADVCFDDGGDEDGPPECWADCSGFDTLYEGMNGGVFCDFYVDAYNGDCLDDCSDEDGPDELLYSFCYACLNDESIDCDDIFGEDCVDLDYSDCEDDSACEWNDYEQTCEDVDDDGDVDVLVVNLEAQADSFFRNDISYFVDITAEVGLAVASRRTTRFGVVLADFDNDGYLDIYEANGRINPGDTFQDVFAEPNTLYRGSESVFNEVFPMGGVLEGDIHTSRGVAVGDLNNDGGLDLVVVNRDARPYVLLNRVDDRGNWVRFSLFEANGTPARGVRVSGFIGDRQLNRHQRIEGSYLASSDSRIHFGLGEQTAIENVTVKWSDGTQEVFGNFASGTHFNLKRSTSLP